LVNVIHKSDYVVNFHVRIVIVVKELYRVRKTEVIETVVGVVKSFYCNNKKPEALLKKCCRLARKCDKM